METVPELYSRRLVDSVREMLLNHGGVLKRLRRVTGLLQAVLGGADRMVSDIVKHAGRGTLVIVVVGHGHIAYVYGAAMMGNMLIKAGGRVLPFPLILREPGMRKGYGFRTSFRLIDIVPQWHRPSACPTQRAAGVCNARSAHLAGVETHSDGFSKADLDRVEDCVMQGLTLRLQDERNQRSEQKSLGLSCSRHGRFK